MAERKVKVENTLGIHRGVVIERPLSEAQYLEATGQGRIIWEKAVAPKVETPEEPVEVVAEVEEKKKVRRPRRKRASS